MNELAAQYPRWGYRRIWELLRQERIRHQEEARRAALAAGGPQVPAKRQRRGQKDVGGRAGASRLPIGPPLDAAQADEVIGAVTSFGGGTRLHLVA